MQYITAAQAAEKWGLTVRRVQDLCRNHQIHGAVRWGRDWMIPNDAHRPADRRKKVNTVQVADNVQLPRKNPAIIFSNLYHQPGSAEQVAESLENRPEAAQLFRAQVAYFRGEFETACALVETLLQGPCDHDLQIGCGIVYGKCAIAAGNLEQWRKANEYIKTAPCYTPQDRYAVDFWLAGAESDLREANTFPLWFQQGRFDVLPGDSYPGARFYYVRYLYLYCHERALGYRGDPDRQNAMKVIPFVAEPLIAQSHKEGALISEAYMRLVCAAAYHDMGNDAMAIHHLDIAIRLLLPDRLYLILAEYRRQMDFLMDERLNLVDPAVTLKVKAFNKQFLSGWTELHNTTRGRTVSNELTVREREVAKHAAFGLSNKEIAERLNISVNTVKQSLRNAMDKTGAMRRSELAYYI